MSTKDSIARRLVKDAAVMADPVAVERAELSRMQDALGEICLQFSHIRKQWGADDSCTQIAEALMEMNGLLHYAQDKCFLPDPVRSEPEAAE